MHRSKIEWCRNPDGSPGWVWNPITGCLNHVNGLCKGGNFPCYAYRLAHGRLRERYLANSILPTHDEPNHEAHHSDPFYPRFWPERLGDPFLRVKPAGIFVCDMSDLFGIGIPREWTQQVMETVRVCPQHRFYLLTKQPQNLIKFSPFPDNCWVGVTVCNQDMANTSIPVLMNIAAGKRYVSIEPMLEPVDLSRIEFGRYLPENKPYYVNAFEDRYIFGDEGDIELRKIDWVIIGAQTKPYKPPNSRWVHEIACACREAGIPYFLKDNLVGCLPVEAPYYRMPGTLIQKEGFSYITDKPILI